MAAHTFAPEESLPPPKAAVIYSRDGRKRSLNIDMTRYFSPSINEHSTAFSSSTSPSSAAAGPGRQGSSIETSTHHATKDVNQLSNNSPAHKKKKKKKTKKKTLERIEESEHGHNGHNSSTTSRQSNGTHGHSHANCRHEDGSHHHHHRHHAHQMPEPRIQPNNPDNRPHPHAQTHPHSEHEDEEEEDEDFYSDEDPYDPETPAFSSSHEGEAHTGSSLSKKKKKKRKKTTPTTTTTAPITATGGAPSSVSGHASSKALVHPTSGYRHDHAALAKHMHDNHPQNDGFWHYSDAEERQRIREFWFQLREEERRSLVRVEKEAVLKKMKEQQRHSCSCSLCGRKRYIWAYFFDALV